MSHESVPAGELAAVVTFLEMRQLPPIDASPSSLELRRVAHPDVATYRELFRLIGAPWLWFSRLVMTDAKLAAIIADPRVELFTVVDQQGRNVGLIELDLREPGECELAFVGLIAELTGKGHGKWLLSQAVRQSWREGITRVHVHTCSLDHPAALSAYRRAGFVAFKRAIERFPDPRLLGILPRQCAPQIPIIND